MTSGPCIGSRQKKIGYYCGQRRLDAAKQKEEGSSYEIQSNKVIIALFGIEFDSKATRVSR